MIICLDLEGVLVPEIWIEVSKITKIKDLNLTTRDIPDYRKLMLMRIDILKKNHIDIKLIQRVIASIKPLPGAKKFLNNLRAKKQVIILSDTFYEFAGPLMKQLDYPTIFCNYLVVGRSGYIEDFKFRQIDGKKKSVLALKSLGFEVRAAGDSYNDVSMIQTADKGAFFNPPTNIVREYPAIPVYSSYTKLEKFLL